MLLEYRIVRFRFGTRYKLPARKCQQDARHIFPKGRKRPLEKWSAPTFGERLMKYVVVILTVSTLLLSGCGGCGFAHNERIDGPYHLCATDVSTQMRLSYNAANRNGVYVARVPATVFAVGWNEEYLVAKRHPNGDKSKTEYYYLIRKLDHEYADRSKCVRGPFSKTEFETKKNELDLPEFSRVLSSLK